MAAKGYSFDYFERSQNGFEIKACLEPFQTFKNHFEREGHLNCVGSNFER